MAFEGTALDLAKIKSLIDLVSRSQVSELELIEGDTTLRIRRGARAAAAPPPPAAAAAAPPATAAPAAADTPAPKAAAPDEGLVTSPSFGVFHRTAAPGAQPFVAVGDAVAAGQTLCLLEAMKVFTGITAGEAGVIDAILAEAGAEVEVGQPLFRIRR
jgi:acetyl-CoA carboxylase biotin carboxyl carrier protein